MEIELPAGWRPRNYQAELWCYLEAGGLRADVAAHRRWGKDDVALNWAAVCAVQRPGVYWHLLPEAAQARKAIWEAVNPHTGRRRIDEAFPPQIRSATRDGDMTIRLANGALWQVLGSDNYDSLVGAPPRGVGFSEWALAKPEAWTYIRPILAENGGWALFLWTPRGRNHAVRAFEARFASEYLVDFDAAAPGAYYAGLLAEAEKDGRIGRVPHDPALAVQTAWDLGIDDYTAVWFFQQVGREVRAIDYFETSGEGLQAIVREAIAAKPYVYGAHHLPHDVMVRELGAGGRSRFETLGGLGVQPIEVGRAVHPEERVNAGRLMIPITWFDAEKCAAGLERLRAYRKRWNAATHSYAGPLHDAASHGADAFGEFALNRRGAPERRPARRGGGGEAGSWMG